MLPCRDLLLQVGQEIEVQIQIRYNLSVNCRVKQTHVSSKRSAEDGGGLTCAIAGASWTGVAGVLFGSWRMLPSRVSDSYLN